jgi:hypothetical protein
MTCVIQGTCFYTTFVVLIWTIMNFHMCLKVLYITMLSPNSINNCNP